MLAEEIELCRRDVAYYIRRLYKKGLTTTLGGNISAKCGETVLMTPSGMDKALVRRKHIAVFSLNGINRTPEIRPTIESALHFSIYRHRKDVGAIVHAHPPLSSVFTAMHKKIDCKLIAESWAVLGEPAVATYALMGSASLAEAVSHAAISSNVILMKNHGIVCLGEDLVSAFNRVEALEAAARMTIIADITGDCTTLNEQQIKEIEAMLSGHQ